MKRNIRIFLAVLLAAAIAVSASYACSLRLSEARIGAETAALALPAYRGEPSAEYNGGRPLFTREELDSIRDVRYSDLDALGRCGPAVGFLGPETLPTQPRGPIGPVKPSGWHTVRYDDRIEDRYLYNRCHLIGYQLAGGNADPRNLITGTRSLNVAGMLPYETMVRAYIEQSGGHVLYRVTPVFQGENLVAAGVLMEAWSVEDCGHGICLCRYVFNVQPGVVIDYATGRSFADASYDVPEKPEDSPHYILNISSRKFHLPDCPAAAEIRADNRLAFFGTREEAVAQGYEPCGWCRP